MIVPLVMSVWLLESVLMESNSCLKNNCQRLRPKLCEYLKTTIPRNFFSLTKKKNLFSWSTLWTTCIHLYVKLWARIEILKKHQQWFLFSFWFLGQCHICGSAGNNSAVLATTWLHRSQVQTCNEEWRATLYGENSFYRTDDIPGLLKIHEHFLQLQLLHTS